jgi:hypothetical protein
VPVGREGERTRLDNLIARARGGESAALLIHGEPGVGKTRMLEHAAATAADFKVLRARPFEAESELAFAGLSELLRPVLHLLGRIPGPQDAALSGALALGPPVPGDRFAVAVVVLRSGVQVGALGSCRNQGRSRCRRHRRAVADRRRCAGRSHRQCGAERVVVYSLGGGSIG